MIELKSLNEIRLNPDPKEAIKQKLSELASLESIDYAIQRKDAAKELSLGVTVLDKLIKDIQGNGKNEKKAFEQFENWAVSMWPEEVIGSELFNEIFQTFEKYVIADRESLEAASMWVALTWLTDYATVLPMAMITAPEKGCGKTVFLSVVEKFSCRPLQACNITPSALFRSVEAWSPTLLIDEADSFLRENEELRGILNSGHTRNSAYVIKTEEIKGARQPVRFKTWGAKAIAGIKLEGLSATLTSRSILLPLRRKKPSEKTENLRHAEPEQFDTLRQKLYRWSLDNGEIFGKIRPGLPELQNRDGDNWEPLLAIAQLAGNDWLERIKYAAIKIVGKVEESPSLEEELLRDIKSAFEKKGIDRISTVELLGCLATDELAPWATYNRGQPMRARQLSNRLRSYSIYPKSIRICGTVHKGYMLSDFADIFERYILSPDKGDLPVTRLQGADTAEVETIFPVTPKELLPKEIRPKSLFGDDCSGVTAKKGWGEGKTNNEVVEVEI